MHDCNDDIVAFHKEKVVLSTTERTEMRNRRNANRDRLKSGLKSADEPTAKCKSQGSYAMWTMVQDTDKDYDIDDGVYFTKESLVGPRGGDKTPTAAKAMVRDAVDSGTFKNPPEVRKNCVRVFYQEGYHVDLPVYREVKSDDDDDKRTYSELASTEWKVSDPQSVTEWLRREDRNQSPDSGDAVRQLRRIVRMLKSFARSRKSWSDSIASGFMITALVVEQYVADEDREDRALYNTMVEIRNRLHSNLKIKHPTVTGEYLTKGEDDSRARFLREKLDSAIGKLEPLFRSACTHDEALEAWDTVFATTFFSERSSDDDSDGQACGRHVPGASASIPFARRPYPTKPVDKRGGGRYG